MISGSALEFAATTCFKYCPVTIVVGAPYWKNCRGMGRRPNHCVSPHLVYISWLWLTRFLQQQFLGGTWCLTAFRSRTAPSLLFPWRSLWEGLFFSNPIVPKFGTAWVELGRPLAGGTRRHLLPQSLSRVASWPSPERKPSLPIPRTSISRKSCSLKIENYIYITCGGIHSVPTGARTFGRHLGDDV